MNCEMDLRYYRAVYIACCAEQSPSPFMTPYPYIFDIHLNWARKLGTRVSVMSRFGKPLVLILAFAACTHLAAAQGNITKYAKFEFVYFQPVHTRDQLARKHMTALSLLLVVTAIPIPSQRRKKADLDPSQVV